MDWARLKQGDVAFAAGSLALGWLLFLGTLIPGCWVRSRDWQPVSATVLASKLSRFSTASRIEWHATVQTEFPFQGRTEKGSVRVFVETDRAAADQRLKQDWPEGKCFTQYVDAANPQRGALRSDGDIEGLLVVAVFFGLFLALPMTLLFAYVWRRAGASPTSPPGAPDPAVTGP